MPTNTYGMSSGLWANHGHKFEYVLQQKHDASPRGRLEALAQMVSGQTAYENPFQGLGYQTQLGDLRDTLSAQSDRDAGRAGALGLTPGAAVGAGAGARALALATGIRGAAAGAENTAEARRSRAQVLLASIYGGLAGMDERDKDRKANEQAQWLNMLGQIAGAGVGAASGKPPTP